MWNECEAVRQLLPSAPILSDVKPESKCVKRVMDAKCLEDALCLFFRISRTVLLMVVWKVGSLVVWRLSRSLLCGWCPLYFVGCLAASWPPPTWCHGSSPSSYLKTSNQHCPHTLQNFLDSYYSRCYIERSKPWHWICQKCIMPGVWHSYNKRRLLFYAFRVPPPKAV